MKDFLRQTAAVAKKELLLALVSPALYIAAALFVVAAGTNYFVVGQFFIAGKASSDLRTFYSFFPYISILAVPVLTMNLWAGEADGVVFSLPLQTGALVLGKWLSALAAALGVQLALLSVPLAVNRFGSVDWGQVFAANCVVLLYFAAVCALGQFLSLLTKSQITAALVTAAILALVNCVHLVPLYLNLGGFTARLSNAASFAWHFDAASKGILDSRDICFYLVCTAALLCATAFVIERRKENS